VHQVSVERVAAYLICHLLYVKGFFCLTVFRIFFFSSVFCKILKRFYLFDTEREREHKQAEREGEAGSLLSKEPDVGLSPRTLGS